MIENVKYDIAYAEVYEILNFLGEDFLKKIPSKLLQEINDKRRKNYSPNVVLEDGTINEEKLSKTALAIFSFLNYKFIIEDEEEKKRLAKIWLENE